MKNEKNEQVLNEKYEEIIAQLYEESKVKIDKKHIILWVVTTLVMGTPIVAGFDLLSIVIKNKLIMKECRKAVLDIAKQKEDSENETYEGEVVA